MRNRTRRTGAAGLLVIVSSLFALLIVGGTGGIALAGLLILAAFLLFIATSVLALLDVQQASALRLARTTPLPGIEYGADPGPRASLAAVARREVVRRQVRRDPYGAVADRVGRPDLVGSERDGGLVDLNSAPAPLLAHAFRLPPETAEQIVAQRQAVGGFRHPEQAYAGLPLPEPSRVLLRELALALPRVGADPAPAGPTPPGPTPPGPTPSGSGGAPVPGRPSPVPSPSGPVPPPSGGRFSRVTSWTAVLFSVTTVVFLIALVSSPPGAPSGLSFALFVAGLLLLPVLVVSLVVDGVRAVHRRRTAAPPDPPSADPQDPAVAAALAARERRAEARRLVAGDPLLAAELHIGRPDLGGDYDDGGLVDLNAAPAEVIARLCRIEPELAERIVTARGTAGGFLAVDDVFTLTDLPVSAWDRIRDRAVLVGTGG